MASWNGLPVEMRQEIVERLDFRSRFRFRHVSKTSQELVDSTPLYIPRVVFCAKDETEAKLTFYTGIEKWIDVEFKNHEEQQQCTVKVTETSFNESTELGTARLVDAPDAPRLALTAFRNVAQHRKTVCGGVDLLFTNFVRFKSVHEAREFFREATFRAKVIVMSFAVCPELLVRFSRADIEELHMMNDLTNMDKIEGVPEMIVNTNRMKVRIEPSRVDESRGGWTDIYLLTEEEDISKLFDEEEFEGFMKDESVIKHSPNDISLYNIVGCGSAYMRVNSCGMLIRNTSFGVRNEDPARCEMRNTCAKCADPFEHWYFKRTARAIQVPIPVGQMSAVKLEPKWSYKEFISPIVNGVSSLDEVMHTFRSKYYRDHAAELEQYEEMKEVLAEAKGAQLDPVFEFVMGKVTEMLTADDEEPEEEFLKRLLEDVEKSGLDFGNLFLD